MLPYGPGLKLRQALLYACIIGYILFMLSALESWTVHLPKTPMEEAQLARISGVYAVASAKNGPQGRGDFIVVKGDAYAFRCSYGMGKCLNSSEKGRSITIWLSPSDAHFAVQVKDTDSQSVLVGFYPQKQYLLEFADARTKNSLLSAGAALAGLILVLCRRASQRPFI
jgi:hypothetical protein